MKVLIFCMVLLAASRLEAQELFIQTEPASNMPVGTFGIRFTGDSWQDPGRIVSREGMELMYGVTRNLMTHILAYGSNSLGNFDLETVGFYSKYRLYWDDGFKYHFRVSAYGEALFGSQHSDVPTFSFAGSGPIVSGGGVATLLEHRLALSTTIGASHALKDIALPTISYSNISGINASLSAGYLILPAHYSSFSDLNMNVYAEFLGYHTWFTQDVAGVIAATQGTELLLSVGPQVIINSLARIDLAYTFPIFTNFAIRRPNSVLARFEYDFYQ
jgi:hypothetical protein